MKLLIVDDYPGVVNGLVQGVDWDKLGIDRVLTAQNAMEARLVLQEYRPDIMLCDIEMPVENGMALFQWMKREAYETLCIFLTSHAEFQYAQEALKLGAFDYVVQPAPYAEVSRVVEKAVKQIRSNTEQSRVYDMGRVFSKQAGAITSAIQRDYLDGAPNQRELDSMVELGRLPPQDRLCQLVMLQVVRWSSLTKGWEGPLLGHALSNMVEEIFTPPIRPTVVAHMEDYTFSLILHSEDPEDLNQDAFSRQLQYLNSVCKQYLHGTFAFYLSRVAFMKQLPGLWRRLQVQRDDNVALQGGVFFLESAQPQASRFHIPRVKHLGKLLREGYPQAMEEEAFTLLDELVENGTLNAVTLRHFYQDYLQMLYSLGEGHGDLLQELFSGREALDLYCNGMRTIDQMKALIHHVAMQYHTATPVAEQTALIKQVTDFIDTHLESELRRDDLAAQVHLNADYLTRIFKKETGMTLKEYITRQKMREAQSLLRTTSLPVGIIAAKLGYCNFSHFSYTYKKVMGLTPLEERQPGGQGKESAAGER